MISTKLATKGLKTTILSFIPFRGFRNWNKITPNQFFPDYRYYNARERVSPYKPEFTLTEEEKIENEKLPITERVLDWTKYMKHKGKLKYSLGTFLVDVEPFPRLKIMMLCDVIMKLLKECPDSFYYKSLSYEYIKYIMRVVDENESIVDIESKLTNFISAEHLIMKLHDEVTLLQTFIQSKIWQEEPGEEPEVPNEEFFRTAAFRDIGHPFPDSFDSANHKKNEKPERPKTANID